MQGTRKGLIKVLKETVTNLSKFDEGTSKAVSVAGLMGSLQDSIFELEAEEKEDLTTE